MQSDFDEIVGQCIRDHREAKHVSPTELARQLGTSRPTIVNWETAKTVPDVRNARAMCDLLEISPFDILGYDANDKARPSFTKEEATLIKP